MDSATKMSRGQIVVFDSAAEGWESLDILAPQCPMPRARHTMESIGPSALVCKHKQECERISDWKHLCLPKNVPLH